MDLLSTISQLQQDKRSRHIMPDHVTEIELIREICRGIKIEINRLVEEGYINEFRTLNDNAFAVND